MHCGCQPLIVCSTDCLRLSVDRSAQTSQDEEAVIEFDELEAKEAYRLVESSDRLIHGAAVLAAGYRLAVPTHKAYTEAIIDDYLPDSKNSRIHHPPGVTNMLLSIFQIMFASFTLGISTRHQIPLWGYASYGLSVFPYALMSVMNLICAGLVGGYSSGQILWTPILEESGGQYDGIIGARKLRRPTMGEKADNGYVAVKMTWSHMRPVDGVTTDCAPAPAPSCTPSNPPADLRTPPNRRSDSGPNYGPIVIEGLHHNASTGKEESWSKKYVIQGPSDVMSSSTPRFTLSALSHNGPPLEEKLKKLQRITWSETMTIISLFLVALLMPYALLHAMTGFQPSASTVSQRVWMMAWLAADQFSSFVVLVDWLMWKTKHELIPKRAIYMTLTLLTIPGIGGFVTLGKMFLVQSGFGIGNCETT